MGGGKDHWAPCCQGNGPAGLSRSRLVSLVFQGRKPLSRRAGGTDSKACGPRARPRRPGHPPTRVHTHLRCRGIAHTHRSQAYNLCACTCMRARTKPRCPGRVRACTHTHTQPPPELAKQFLFRVHTRVHAQTRVPRYPGHTHTHPPGIQHAHAHTPCPQRPHLSHPLPHPAQPPFHPYPPLHTQVHTPITPPLCIHLHCCTPTRIYQFTPQRTHHLHPHCKPPASCSLHPPTSPTWFLPPSPPPP